MSLLTVVLLAVAAAALWAALKLRMWLRLRGARVVTCPETKAPAGVELNAAQAGVFRPQLRLESCSRWPERQSCGQECVRQIEAAPADCLVRNLFTRWYEGRPCCYCRKPFGAIQWAEQKPGLLDAGGRLLDWTEIKAEDVPETLQTAQPVCFSCYIATRFAQDHPGLVVDRAR